MSASPVPLRDPDLLKVGDALRRAAAKALEIALQTGTPCYIWQDGRMINIGTPTRAPRRAMRVQETPPPSAPSVE
jgi:hypothetical protein